MDRQQAKELLPIIQAYSEGKTILVKDKRLSDEEDSWSETDDCSFNIEKFDYRIKPEPKYRPFKDAEECWAEMEKHQPFGWVKDKSERSKHSIYSNVDNNADYEADFDDYTFADGLPFGVKVEE